MSFNSSRVGNVILVFAFQISHARMRSSLERAPHVILIKQPRFIHSKSDSIEEQGKMPLTHISVAYEHQPGNDQTAH